MSFAPNDLVTDTDLVAYERTILTQMGAQNWQARRKKAIEDWLYPLLEGRGFSPQLLRTRYEIAHAFDAAGNDVTEAATTEDGLTLLSLFPTATSYLYVGYPDPFRGVSIRMNDLPNTINDTLQVAVWADTWLGRSGTDLSDGTIISNHSLRRGGAVTWTVPDDVVARSLYGVGPYHWARLNLTKAPSAGSKMGAVSVIRRSRLCAPVALRTIAMIMREAPAKQDGPWTEKAQWYESEAEKAWLRVADQIGPEFDTDRNDMLNDTELNQTAAQVSGGGWTLERG